MSLEAWQSRSSTVLASQANIFGCLLRCFWKVRTRYQPELAPGSSIVAPVLPRLLADFNRDVCDEIRNT